MSSLCEQLLRAYRQEEQLYLRIMELVNRQHTMITVEGNPRGVLGLCCEVEKLLDEIAVIEEAIAPAKTLWEGGERDAAAGELDAVLATVQAVIEQTALAQQHVRMRLLEYGKTTRSAPQGVPTGALAGLAQLA